MKIILMGIEKLSGLGLKTTEAGLEIDVPRTRICDWRSGITIDLSPKSDICIDARHVEPQDSRD